MKRYNPTELEPKWQKVWDQNKTFEVTEDSDKTKKYVIDMFPYPSGAAMHVGHMRNFTISDVLSQFLRQKGYNVMHTMGWDTFGLPAENYAIKTGVPPQQSTRENIANFKGQLQRLGMSYDWSREINTTDPEYYKWTQWIFTQMFNDGLAYQKESLQWWCPTDKTVLANEQVEAGKCWRCGNEVIKKSMYQWFFKITDYADQLLEGIDGLDWPEKIKSMQRNWIGRSQGAVIKFQVDNAQAETVEVFTTRPDTLFGASFMVLAPEHPLVSKLTVEAEKSKVESYIKKAQKKSNVERMEAEREKTGVFTGSYAINPANDAKLPVYVADYVLMDYGTGAIMAVPAHDERDYDFAVQHELPVTEVVAPEFGEYRDNEQWVDGTTVIAYNQKTDKYLGLKWEDGSWVGLVAGGIDEGEDYEACARRELAEEAGITDTVELERLGEAVFAHYQHKVKQINRVAKTQGFIAVVDDNQGQDHSREAHEKFQPQWYSRQELSEHIGKLSAGHHWQKLLQRAFAWVEARQSGQEHQLSDIFTGEGILINSGQYSNLASSEAREKIVADLAEKGVAQEKVNYRMHDWLISRQRYWGAPIPIIHCQTDGAVAVPEEDLPVVLPEVESYAPTGEGTSALATVEEWVNTTCPKCGGPAKRETDTMDGYACSSWYFLRYTDPHNDQQAWDPAKANYWMPIDYYCGGDHAVSHLLYSRFWMYFFADKGLIEKTRREPVGKLVYNGYIMAPDGTKMSKSKGNVINPDAIIEQGYGADSLRLFEMFIAPYEQDTSWNTNGVPGTFRFLQRVWTLAQEFLASDGPSGESSKEVLAVSHRTIKKVTEDLDGLSFNTAVAALMEAVNNLYRVKASQGFAAREDWRFALTSLTQLLAPFAPHMAEELWQQFGNESSVHISNWPQWDEQHIVADTVTVAVQVNGKVRAELSVAPDAGEDAVKSAALQDGNVQQFIDGKDIKRVIYVPGRLINLVV